MRTAAFVGALLFVCPLIYPSVSLADANDYVSTPIVVEGEKEIDLKSGAEKLRNKSGGTATSIGLGWAPTAWWFTEFYGKYKRDPGTSNAFDAWELENKFQLTETGRFPVDVGVLLEIERPSARAEGYELVYGPLLQSEWGQIQGNLNLLIKQHFDNSVKLNTELIYQVQLKYRASLQFEWGAQAFGSFSRFDRRSPYTLQENKIGPAIFGKIKTGNHQAINYNAAILFGTTANTARTTLRIQTEYEF